MGGTGSLLLLPKPQRFREARDGGKWSYWRSPPTPQWWRRAMAGRERKKTLFSVHLAGCPVINSSTTTKKSSKSKPNLSQLKALLFLLLQVGLELITRKLKLYFCAKCSDMGRHHAALIYQPTLRFKDKPKERLIRDKNEYLLMQESVLCVFSGLQGRRCEI